MCFEADLGPTMDGQIDPNATKPWPRYGQKTKNEESFWNRTSFYGFFIHSRGAIHAMRLKTAEVV